MSDERRAVLAVKAVKNAVVRRLPSGPKVRARDAYHRLRLRLNQNPLGRPDEHEEFLATELDRLEEADGRRLTYVEFGVYQGAPIGAAVRGFDRAGAGTRARFVGFDSFEGLPPGSEAEGWGSGWFVTSKRTAEWNLRRQKVLDRVELVEGWFDDTCTPAMADDLGTVDVVMFDCDLYSATATAIAFVEPLLADPCLLIFDDYLVYNAQESTEIGQVKAFDEYLARNPQLGFERLGRVGHCGVGFLVGTAVGREDAAAQRLASSESAAERI